MPRVQNGLLKASRGWAWDSESATWKEPKAKPFFVSRGGFCRECLRLHFLALGERNQKQQNQEPRDDFDNQYQIRL